MYLFNDIAILPNDTHISKWVRESGRLDHDQNMLPIVLPFIKPGAIVIDAGAYIGDHTIAYAKSVGVDGFVFAFEPSPEAFECLQYNLEGMTNTTCFNQGLSSKIGSKGIVKYTNNIGMNYLSEGNDISVTSIDDLGLFGVDFIKIDCEGYELEILKGAYETINKYKPVLLIEINKETLKRNKVSEKDIFKFLENAGYKYRNIYFEQSLSGEQYDIICEPKQ